MDSDDINVWQEIIDNVFYDNYVKGDPTKFLNALEKTLKENGYSGPINPERPNNFGNPGGEFFDRLKKNYKAIQGLESDKQNRPLDRYIIDDILVNKFFNGDVSTAGKFYQEWLKTRGEYLAHKNVNGSENNMFKNIEDIPVWTPNNDVVKYAHWGYMFDHLFGGKYYESHETQDKKRKDDEEYYKNRDEGKYRDVCPRCSSNANMKWVKSEDDYPKGYVSLEEFCSKCNPSGKPLPMLPQHYLIDCDICGVTMDKESEQEKTKENAEYWKKRMDDYEGVPNSETDPTYLNYKKQYEFFKKQQDTNEAKKCKCSFEKLKAVYDHYMEYEDYDSLANMQKNPLYKTFFDELNKNQNLTESIQRIKSIMKLL
jgi:hypothetical protein